MKRILSIICFTIFATNALADEKVLHSTITSVVAYPDSGAVTRQAEVSLPAGEYTLYFQNLPSGLDTNSVQVNAEASVASTILDITTKEQRKLEVPNERLQALDKQIEVLKNERLALHDQANVLAAEQVTLLLVQKGMLVPDKNGVRPTLAELKNIMLFSKDKLAESLESLRLIAEQKQRVDEKIEQLNAERLPLSQQNIMVKNVAVRIYLEKAGTVNLSLTYVVRNIAWSPRYDIRFDSHNNKLVLTYLGSIHQTTGEDWSNVKVILSTARPSLDTTIPVLSPWHLNERSKPAPQPRLQADMMGSMTSDYVAETPVASVSQELTSASFNILKPITLLSGSANKTIEIAHINLPITLSYIAVPKLSQAVYLQVNTVNKSDFTLLEGQTNIFMDNRFVSSGYLNTTMPNEKFILDLGIDPTMAVTYKQVKQFTEQTGLTNSYTKITYDYLVTIQNNKMTAEKIQVLNQIPVSGDDQITVKLLSPSAKGILLDKEGKLTDEWILKPHEKKEQQLKYFVEYPNGLKVLGL